MIITTIPICNVHIDGIYIIVLDRIYIIVPTNRMKLSGQLQIATTYDPETKIHPSHYCVYYEIYNLLPIIVIFIINTRFSDFWINLIQIRLEKRYLKLHALQLCLFLSAVFQFTFNCTRMIQFNDVYWYIVTLSHFQIIIVKHMKWCHLWTCCINVVW